LHSGYSTEAFRFQLFDTGERARMREIVGEEAERLVFAFCATRHDVLLTAAEHDGGRVEIALRWNGAAVALDRRDLADLMILHAANLAEQAAGPRGAPTTWLAPASRLLAAARADAEVAPPVFGGGIVAPRDEALLLRAYRVLLRAPDDASAKTRRRRVVLASPVGEPLVLAGLHALAQGDAEAADLGERAIATLDAWSVAWDKRLSLARWRELAKLVAYEGRKRDQELLAAAQRARSALEAARRSPARLWSHLDALEAFSPEATPAPAKRVETSTTLLPPRFAEYVAGLRSNIERPLLPFYPGLTAKPFHDAAAFPIVADLERLAPEIAREVRSLPASNFQDELEDIERKGRWSVLFVLEMGRRNEEVLARCPATRSILERAHVDRLLAAQAGSMYFSRLDPGTKVAPHRGPTNLRLRCHLGLDVPERCGMRVGGLTSGWQEGRCVVFDDSFTHEVWNESDRPRTVLVLDLWHPDLGDDEIALLSGLERYGSAHGAVTRGFWARNERARNGARRESGPAEDDALARARRAVADRPSDARAHLALGHELSRARRWAEAEASARAALEIDPMLAMAHNNLAYSRHMQGDAPAAIASYQEALRVDPSCGRARRNLATLLASLERHAEALEARGAPSFEPSPRAPPPAPPWWAPR
jgi:aspartate beta-hydroxylase